MAYNPFDPNSRYRLPSYNLNNPLSTTGLGGALSSQQPTTDWMSNPQPRPYEGTSGGTNPFAFGTPEAADWTRQNVGDVNFSRTPPRTTTDTSILNTAPEAGFPTAITAGARDTRYGSTDSLGRATTLNNVMSSAPTPGITTPSATPGTTSTAGLPAGFDLRAGSNDPAVNQQIYGSNYFPGNLPGFEGVRDTASFNALTPQQQGDYRVALYNQYQRGGAGGAPGYPAVNSTGAAGPGPGGAGAVPPTGLPTRGTSLDDPMSRLDDNLRFPQQSITPTEVMMDPGFKWQQEQLGRKLEDIFAAKGRVGSTDYFNALTNANQKLISDEYNRINNQQWERGMEMNRLLYDRRAQENITNYEREFRENERKYGRQQAEDILAYERAFREDARDYDELWKLYQLGFLATNASGGT